MHHYLGIREVRVKTTFFFEAALALQKELTAVLDGGTTNNLVKKVLRTSNCSYSSCHPPNNSNNKQQQQHQPPSSCSSSITMGSCSANQNHLMHHNYIQATMMTMNKDSTKNTG
jgi:hypothetical protein